MGWLRGATSVRDTTAARSDRLPGAIVASLVWRAKHGDVDAFGLLYDHYIGEVYAFVAARVRDREAAQDVTQAIFTRALQSLGACQEDAAFPGWLFAIARNSVTDYHRAARFRPDALDETFDREDPDLTPEECAIRKDDARVLATAREQCLSARDRELFDLVLTGMNDRQIGEALGRTHGATRVAHHRLMSRLRDCLRRLGLLGEIDGASA